MATKGTTTTYTQPLGEYYKREEARQELRSRRVRLYGGIGIVIFILAIALGVGLGVGLKERISTIVYPSQSYSLVSTYSGSSFFDGFEFFTDADPTNGYVTYVSKDYAASNNLTYTSSSSAGQRVFMQTGKTANYSGVTSVRLQSIKNYTQGLFVIDLVHIPYGCGVWPAFWTVNDGDDYPRYGEIDIIEAVNLDTTNQITLHSNSGCSMSSKNRNMTGQILSNSCAVGNADGGCGVNTTSSLSYGAGFNANGGGVYAMDWRDNGIRVWFFPRSSLPSDLSSSSLSAGSVPTQSGWGQPSANFPNNKCSITDHFANHKIIFDLDFCGTYAGAGSIWNTSSCYDATKYKICNDYIHANIGTMPDVYWEINGVYVYQAAGATVTK